MTEFEFWQDVVRQTIVLLQEKFPEITSASELRRMAHEMIRKAIEEGYRRNADQISA